MWYICSESRTKMRHVRKAQNSSVSARNHDHDNRTTKQESDAMQGGIKMIKMPGEMRDQPKIKVQMQQENYKPKGKTSYKTGRRTPVRLHRTQNPHRLIIGSTNNKMRSRKRGRS